MLNRREKQRAGAKHQKKRGDFSLAGGRPATSAPQYAGPQIVAYSVVGLSGYDVSQ